MIYRQLRQNETGFLKQMLYEALFVPPDRAPFPYEIIDQPELSKYIKNWGQLPDDLAIVCASEEELIGAVWGRSFKLPNVGYGFLDEQIPEISMAVRKEFRNQGIGSELITLVCDLYRAGNKTAVSLSVDQLNPAIALYKRNGFEIIEECGTAWTMKKELK